MQSARDAIFSAFDTETTGLDPQKGHIVEIAGVRFTGQGGEISRFATLANPGVAISPQVTQIHGINDHMVSRAPDSGHACRQFTSWLGGDDILLAHNAAFDTAFIGSALAARSLPAPRNPVVDTLKCMKYMAECVPGFRRPPNFRLGTLVDYFGLPETGYHRAMADSLHVMGLFMRFLETMEQLRGPLAPAELFAIGGVPSIADVRSGRLNGHARFAHISAIIERGEIITLRCDGSARPGGRRVMPLQLAAAADGIDYLLAQCMDDGAVKEFRLDRIIEILPGSHDDRRR